MQEGATGQEVLIKRGDFPVQEQRGGGQRRDRRSQRPKSVGVVDAVSAQEADQAAALIGPAPPAVILFLIDPARPMKRRRRAREHGRQGHGPTGLAARTRQADDHRGHRAGHLHCARDDAYVPH